MNNIYLTQTTANRSRTWTRPDGTTGTGIIKVGETTATDTRKRSERSVGGALNPDVDYQQIGDAYMDVPFTDHDVHATLERLGVTRIRVGNRNSELFAATEHEIRNVINAMLDGQPPRLVDLAPLRLREHQQIAVNATVDYYQAHDGQGTAEFLLNAKMRFGKTLVGYSIADRLNAHRILILTYQPVVADSWHTDLATFAPFETWQFVDREAGDYTDTLASPNPVVAFVSWQDMMGAAGNPDDDDTASDDRYKERNRQLLDHPWDLVIVDEYHHGSWRADPRDVLESLDTPRILFMSGTPFRALGTGEFTSADTWSFTYRDEQALKAAGHPDYQHMPTVHLHTFQTGALSLAGTDAAFDLTEFFRVDGDRFAHETDVLRWLGTVTSPVNASDDDVPAVVSIAQDELAHTVWYMPSVAACRAMTRILERLAARKRKMFHDFAVVDVSGDTYNGPLDALDAVQEAVTSHARTVTLTCGRLLTGVTVPAWTGILMLRELESPATYLQAAFRVQSPTAGKTDAYVLDWAPNRALRMVRTFAETNTGTPDPASRIDTETVVDDMVRYMPVLTVDGSGLAAAMSTTDILDAAAGEMTVPELDLMFRTGSFLDHTAPVDPHLALELAALTVSETDGPTAPTETVVNETPGVTKTGSTPPPSPKDDQDGDTGPKAPSIAEQVKEAATMLPTFLYLSDAREGSLRQMLDTPEPDLFHDVVGMTVDHFSELVDAGYVRSDKLDTMIHKIRALEDQS